MSDVPSKDIEAEEADTAAEEKNKGTGTFNM